MFHLSSGTAIPLTRLAAIVMSSKRFVPPQLPTSATAVREQESLLSEEWTTCCGQIGLPADIVGRWWSVTLNKYTESQRAYHTTNHLYELFCQYYRVVGTYNFAFEDDLRESVAALAGAASALAVDTPLIQTYNGGQYLSSPFASPTAIALTIFFHDVIYDPKAASGVNEEASALLFERFCRDCETVTGQQKIEAWEAQLRAKASMLAAADLDAEEAAIVKQQKQREAEFGQLLMGSGGAKSRAQLAQAEEGVVARAKQFREDAVQRRLDRPSQHRSREELQYRRLVESTPQPDTSAKACAVIPKNVEEQVMRLIRATKNHTATAATSAMETVRHPAVVAMEDQLLVDRSTGLSTVQQQRLLFPYERPHCISFVPSEDTDLGIFLDMDLSIVGVSDRSRYDSYSEQIRFEYSHYPAKAFRAGRATILQRFLDHTDPNGPQPLYKTPLYRFWCNGCAASNLAREIAALAVPELKARTITIGDVPRVAEFIKKNSSMSGDAAAGTVSVRGLPMAAAGQLKISESELQYMAAFNFEFCLMLRIEDESEMMAYLEHERNNSGQAGSQSTLDVTARVQEVARSSPPVAAVILTTLTNSEHASMALRGSQDFCGNHLIVHSIVVHKFYRHRGVGTKLLRELCNKAKTVSVSPPKRISVLCPDVPLPTAADESGNATDVGAGAGAKPAPTSPTSFPAEQLIQNFFAKAGFQRVASADGQAPSHTVVGTRGAVVSFVEMSMPLQ